MSDHSLTLSDGRTLAYGLYGDPQGKPVLFFHGTPGSRHLAMIAADKARERGYCLVAPDRPGLGDSTFQPGRRLEDYSRDIAELCVKQNLRRPGVIGISGGAPYALQCLHDLPEKMPFGILLSGWVSTGRPEMKKVKLSRFFSFYGWATHKARVITRALGQQVVWLIKNKPEKLRRYLVHEMPPADAALLNRPDVAEIFMEDLRLATKQGYHGAEHDGHLQFTAPNFALSAVQQPVYLLHGVRDHVAPVAMGDVLKANLPNVRDYLRDAEGGHLCAIAHLDAIFDQLDRFTA